MLHGRKGKIMKVKAKFTEGQIVPFERLDIEEGAELSVEIAAESESRLSFEERIEITKSSAGGWKGLHDPEEFTRMPYDARGTGSRTDPTP